MATRKNVKDEKCQGHEHPEPTTNERNELHTRLHDALLSIDEAWGFANRTPAYHDLTERLGQAMADLGQIQRSI
jgi:hypothetical protein